MTKTPAESMEGLGKHSQSLMKPLVLVVWYKGVKIFLSESFFLF